MKPETILILSAYLVITTTGLAFMKSATAIVSLPYVFGTGLYAVGYLIFAGIIIRMMPLSLAFPVASAGLIVGTQIAGVAFLREQVSLSQLLAVALILAGIVIMAS